MAFILIISKLGRNSWLTILLLSLQRMRKDCHRGGCYMPGLLQGCTKALQCAHETTAEKPWIHEGYGAHVRYTSRGCCCHVPKHALFRLEKAFDRF
ncbi:hypothetical protein RHMOL_Rhmol09G0118100 [Rhododendron molle]|uniref:Uncharacterized protein n=1 Tax=Rhododendron molle TaxID=49168 RepID=A0ACC0MC58_RHOML|nr:hypothetical protein RHMOL_Rhmol09G0118100 [Rhododendron molle]